MNLINVFKATPGMVLAREVKNREGRHLMDAGICLGEKEIRILRMWGIPEICVTRESMAHGPSRAQGNAVDEFVSHWFRYNNRGAPLVREIMEICRERFDAHPDALEKLRVRLGTLTEDGGEKGGAAVDPEPLLGDDVKLPALPMIYSEINAAVQDPTFSGKEIADIVSKDTSLSATLLRIVNSAYYGLPEKIDSLAYAALALGTRQICSLALGITVINYFRDMPQEMMDMEAFWQHSLGCAILAKNLSTHIPGTDGELVFMGGLLHDIGRLIFLSQFPGPFKTAMARAGKLRLNLVRVEPGLFRWDHAGFGGRLAEVWNFPPRISELIRNHHRDFASPPDKETAIVYVSNWLVSALGIGFSGEKVLPELNRQAWAALGISPAVLVPVVRQTDRQIIEAIRFFYG